MDHWKGGGGGTLLTKPSILQEIRLTGGGSAKLELEVFDSKIKSEFELEYLASKNELGAEAFQHHCFSSKVGLELLGSNDVAESWSYPAQLDQKFNSKGIVCQELDMYSTHLVGKGFNNKNRLTN